MAVLNVSRLDQIYFASIQPQHKFKPKLYLKLTLKLQ